MNTQNQLIKSIIFRPELTPFVKDEDNSLSFLDDSEDFELTMEAETESEEDNRPVFIALETESMVDKTKDVVTISESLKLLRNTRISIAA